VSINAEIVLFKHELHLLSNAQQVVVLTKVGANLDRRGELVSRGEQSADWVFAPRLLNRKRDRGDSQTVREGSVVVHLKLKDGVPRFCVFIIKTGACTSNDILDHGGLFPNSRRRNNNVNVVPLKFLTPLMNEHASHLLRSPHLLVKLLKLRTQQEVAQHNSTLHVQTKVLRPHSLNVLHQILVFPKVGLLTIPETVKARQVSRCFGWNKREVKREAILHKGHRDALNDGPLVFQHFDRHCLDCPVAGIQLLNRELVKNSNS
jgi:hypothetical protein